MKAHRRRDKSFYKQDGEDSVCASCVRYKAKLDALRLELRILKTKKETRFPASDEGQRAVLCADFFGVATAELCDDSTSDVSGSLQMADLVSAQIDRTLGKGAAASAPVPCAAVSCRLTASPALRRRASAEDAFTVPIPRGEWLSTVWSPEILPMVEPTDHICQSPMKTRAEAVPASRERKHEKRLQSCGASVHDKSSGVARASLEKSSCRREGQSKLGAVERERDLDALRQTLFAELRRRFDTDRALSFLAICQKLARNQIIYQDAWEKAYRILGVYNQDLWHAYVKLLYTCGVPSERLHKLSSFGGAVNFVSVPEETLVSMLTRASLSAVSFVARLHHLPLHLRRRQLSVVYTKRDTLSVVLDLDECMVHSVFLDDEMGRGLTAQITREQIPPTDAFATGDAARHEQVDHFWLTLGEECRIKVNRRPCLDEFLLRLSDDYEVYAYTAGVKEYADPVLDQLDPCGNIFKGRFYRNHCREIQGIYLKDLRVIGKDLARVALVDNNLHSFIVNPQNGIPVRPFMDDVNDRELPKVATLIDKLSVADDVRPVLASMFRLESHLAQYRVALRPFLKENSSSLTQQREGS